MATVRELIKMLSVYNQDMPITNEQNENFIHIVNLEDGSVILSTVKPIAICARSGGYVYPSKVEGYFGFSPELDEDVFEIETLPLPAKED